MQKRAFISSDSDWSPGLVRCLLTTGQITPGRPGAEATSLRPTPQTPKTPQPVLASVAGGAQLQSGPQRGVGSAGPFRSGRFHCLGLRCPKQLPTSKNGLSAQSGQDATVHLAQVMAGEGQEGLFRVLHIGKFYFKML